MPDDTNLTGTVPQADGASAVPVPGPDPAVTPAATPADACADLEALDRLERTLFSLRYAAGEVSSLGSVIDPPAACADRGEALATLMQAWCEALCAPEVGPLLDRLAARDDLAGGYRADQVRILRRDRASMLDVPPELQAELSRLTCEADEVWHRAKAASDWSSFSPYLDRIVDVQRRCAQAKDPSRDPYDVLLNEYEWGADRSLYDPFFDRVRECVVPLLADCMASRHQPDRSVVEGTFDAERQWRLAEDLVDLEGIDRDALWLGRTEHPFTGGPSGSFVILASHVYEDDLLSNVFSMLHEGGHALVEQGVARELRQTSLAGVSNMALHESQSRFFENVVGRSEAFAGPLLEALRRSFPGQFARVTPHQLYLAENVVAPSLIRTEADELTYPLHVLVRYEIEQLLLSGEARADDVPRLWAEKYRAYLGVEVPDDAHGALQDVHWSGGSLGYFPTYALGTAFAAQFRDAMVAGGMDFDGTLASGDLAPVRDWLRERVWKWGRSKDSLEIVELACGEPFSPEHYTDYLTRKYSALYRLGA